MLWGLPWAFWGPPWASLGSPGSLLGAFLALFGGPVCVFLVTLGIFNVFRGLQMPSEAFFHTISAYLEASGHLFKRFSGVLLKYRFSRLWVSRLMARRSPKTQFLRLQFPMGPAGWAKPKGIFFMGRIRFMQPVDTIQ